MSARGCIALSVKPLLCLVVALVFLALLSANASADSITIDVSQDTEIDSGSSTNWGSRQNIVVGSDSYFGNERGLFQFALPVIPDGATLESATFRAYYQMPGAGVSENSARTWMWPCIA